MDATLIDHTVAKVYRYHRHEVFDDARVAASQFYLDFLIPVGTRCLAGTKRQGELVGRLLSLPQGLAEQGQND